MFQVFASIMQIVRKHCDLLLGVSISVVLYADQRFIYNVRIYIHISLIDALIKIIFKIRETNYYKKNKNYVILDVW